MLEKKTNNRLCVQKLHPDAFIPSRGSNGAAGYDLYAAESGVIPEWSRKCVGTKIKIFMPDGVYGRIASRSGNSLKHGIEVGAGVVDSDYQGEIKVILYNLSDKPFEFSYGDRIAQLILEKCMTPEVMVELSIEDAYILGRGIGGFGSTGQ